MERPFLYLDSKAGGGGRIVRETTHRNETTGKGAGKMITVVATDAHDDSMDEAGLPDGTKLEKPFLGTRVTASMIEASRNSRHASGAEQSQTTHDREDDED